MLIAKYLLNYKLYKRSDNLYESVDHDYGHWRFKADSDDEAVKEFARGLRVPLDCIDRIA